MTPLSFSSGDPVQSEDLFSAEYSFPKVYAEFSGLREKIRVLSARIDQEDEDPLEYALRRVRLRDAWARMDALARILEKLGARKIIEKRYGNLFTPLEGK